MTACQHEPWLHVPGDHNGHTTPPRTIGGMFTEKAYACRKCGVLYIPLEAQAAMDAKNTAFEADWEAKKNERKTLDVLARATDEHDHEPDELDHEECDEP